MNKIYHYVSIQNLMTFGITGDSENDINMPETVMIQNSLFTNRVTDRYRFVAFSCINFVGYWSLPLRNHHIYVVVVVSLSFHKILHVLENGDDRNSRFM